MHAINNIDAISNNILYVAFLACPHGVFSIVYFVSQVSVGRCFLVFKCQASFALFDDVPLFVSSLLQATVAESF